MGRDSGAITGIRISLPEDRVTNGCTLVYISYLLGLLPYMLLFTKVTCTSVLCSCLEFMISCSEIRPLASSPPRSVIIPFILILLVSFSFDPGCVALLYHHVHFLQVTERSCVCHDAGECVEWVLGLQRDWPYPLLNAFPSNHSPPSPCGILLSSNTLSCQTLSLPRSLHSSATIRPPTSRWPLISCVSPTLKLFHW